MRRLLSADDMDDRELDAIEARREAVEDNWVQAQARHSIEGHEGDFFTTCQDPCCVRDSYR